MGKKYYIYFGNGSQDDDFQFNGIKLSNSCEEKILGVTTDNERKFSNELKFSITE